MTPNEQLKEWIDANMPGKHFAERANGFMELLDPKPAATVVWKWCNKGVAPRKKWAKQIYELTWVDFGAPEEPTSRPPVAVEFEDIERVPSSQPCFGCFIDGGSDECENTAMAFTKMACKSEGFIYQRPKTWVPADGRLLKIGGVVRDVYARDRMLEITYIPICENANPWVVAKAGGSEHKRYISNLEMQIG